MQNEVLQQPVACLPGWALHTAVETPFLGRCSATREVYAVRRVVQLVIVMAERGLKRGQSMEPRVGSASRFIWPWSDSWLVPAVALLGALDHLSTYALLELSGKTYVYESGLLASWALRQGGFNGLYIMDAVAVGLLCIIAATVRVFYSRLGLNGFARTAYVAVLVPYAVAAFAAVVNNFLLFLV